MTPQEQQMIDDLVARIRSTPVANKDVDAERHLQQTLGNVPDALYVLTQTVLVQQYGLEQAKAQLGAQQDEINGLKRQLDAAGQTPQKSGGSFLSRIFGTEENNAAPTAQQAPLSNPGGGYQPVNYAPVPTQGGYPPPPYGAPVYPGGGYGGPVYSSGPGLGGGGFGGGGGGFLRGALQTAAGVAAGAMVFQGMEDLFRGFGGHESHGFGSMPGETVVNNYYGDEGERGDGRELGRNDDASFYNPGHDASREDTGDQGRGFADTGSDLQDDRSDNDDSANGFDDSSDLSDGGDNGGFDDGGGDSNW